MWKVVTSSNLNSLLKLFFYSPILTNNNLFLKIYYENIVVTFLKYDFLFFILFLLSLFSFHPYVFFFYAISSTHVVLSLSPPPFFFFFSLIQVSRTFQHSQPLFFFFFFFFLQLSLFVFLFFLLDSRTVVPNAVQMGQMASVFYLLSFLFFFFFFFFIVMIWLILKLCFWVCILIIWLCLSLEMVERKIVMIVAMRAFLYKCCESTFLSTIFLLIWEDENCGPRRENFLPGFLSSAFSFFCQTVENTVFHPIFIPLFSILTIFIPTKHSVSRTSINLSIFWVSHYFPHEYIASVNIVFWRDSVSDEMPSCFF